MKHVTIFLVLLLFAFTSLALAEKAVRIPFQPAPDEIQYVPNEFVVKLKADIQAFTMGAENGVPVIGMRAFDILNHRFGIDRMKAEFPGSKAEPGVPDLSRHYVLRFRAPIALERVMNAYAENPFVENVEPIGIHPVRGVPDDPYFDDPPVSFPYYQWHFEQGSADHDVDAAAAWDLETGDASVIMGILDSGVRYYHRDLGGYLAPDDVTQGNMWINSGEYGNGKESNGVDDDDNGYVDDWIGWDWVDGVRPCHKTEDCSTPDNDPRDHNGHGTHVAGIVGAITNNTYCGVGMAGGWNASRYEPSNGVKLMALRVGWS
ncbi:MAG: S8 family serine peptidase, partial [Candidatus Zixiibacteriota bacterium]